MMTSNNMSMFYDKGQKMRQCACSGLSCSDKEVTASLHSEGYEKGPPCAKVCPLVEIGEPGFSVRVEHRWRQCFGLNMKFSLEAHGYKVLLPADRFFWYRLDPKGSNFTIVLSTENMIM